MNPLSGPRDLLDDYDIRFDTPLEPIIFGADLEVHGSLLHRGAKPIHGIRAIVTRRFFRPKTVRARRKRNRPEVAVAYPNLPDALASGFLLELRLGFGRSQLIFQVQDHERVWRTFHSASVFAMPRSILTRPGLKNLRRFLVLYFKHLAAGSDSTSSDGSLAVQARDVPTAGFNLQGSSLGNDDRPGTRPQTRVRLFATSKSNLFIVEIGELVAAGFREIGCDAKLLLDEIPEEKPATDTLQIVVTPHEFYNLFLRERFSRPRLRKLTRNVFLLCTEQPETHWFQGNLLWALHARGLADINTLGVTAYRTRGLRCHHLQLGYHTMLAHSDVPPHPARTIDLTFLGSMTPKREAFFAEHAEFFSEHSCHLRLVPLGFAKTKTTKSYLSVEKRNEVLSQSRILLNVHYSDQNYFEWHRMLVALANGCCIITETSRGYGALQPGKHFVMVEPEHLIPCCEYYLAHPEECARIAAQGREFVQNHLRQGQTCRAFLEEVEGAEVATAKAAGSGSEPRPIALPVDAPPVPMPVELLQKLSGQTTQLFRRALRRDFNEMGWRTRKAPPDFAKKIELPISQRAEARRQVVLKREACHDRWMKQEELRLKGDPFLDLHDNSAFAACTQPEVSVLITLYNYAHFIEECVASVEKAAGKLGRACEVLIVNDASTDNSLARALRCQERFQLPIRVVDKKFNTGLADARNVAVELARAPYVFILDADNLIYPDALRQLHVAISTDNYAAAYSLLCRFHGTPRNRVGLLSHFDWDPEILVQFPYIDAMAMFRRDVLREAPGYDHQLSQIGWFGWEDYDMWLRFAQKQHRVAFVPNILCLYRFHETSMINTTILFEFELVQHFIKNYGDLLDRFEPRELLFGIDRASLAQGREKEVFDRRGGNAG